MGAKEQRSGPALTRRGGRLGRAACEIKRVLCVPRRMVGWCVERVEAMILVFDLGAIGDNKTDFSEAAHNILGDTGQRMEFAEDAAAARQRAVGRLGGQGGLEVEVGT